MKAIYSRRRFLTAATTGAALYCLSMSFVAQGAETAPLAGKTATIVVPFGAGGAADVLARIMAEAMSKSLDMNIIVENRLGAGGSLAAAQLARSKPDGLTLGLATLSTHAVSPAVTPKPVYDPVKDFSAVGLIATVPVALVASKPSGLASMAGIVSRSKEKPGSLTFGSPGVGSLGHLLLEQFQQLAGIDILHVPYKGGAEVARALLSAEVDISINNLPNVLTQIQAGKLNLIAITGKKRDAEFPDTPTFAELGYSALNADSWFGLVAPADVPANILAAYTGALNAALAQPALQARIKTLGGEASPQPAERFAQMIDKAYEQAQDIAKSRGIVAG